jgi:hypothetical protein
MVINGKQALLKACDADLIAKKYCKAIGHSAKLHRQIIDKCKTYFETNSASCSIEKFVDGRLWEAIDLEVKESSFENTL